jgi:hypothetical protein
MALTKIKTGSVSDSITLTTPDINGGTIDGTLIGGTTPAAISGTTGQFGTSLNVDGTATVDALTVDGASGTATIALNDSRSNVNDTTVIDFRHNGITGSQIKSTAIEDFSTSANRSSDLSFHVRNNGTIIDAAHINASGNVGIGVVPEDWHANWTALQIGDTGFVGSYTAGATDITGLGCNVWSDGTYKYIETDEAVLYKQQNGTHIFDVAPSGTADAAISWTTAMTIANDGKIAIGNNVPMWSGSYGGALFLKGNNSTADRNAQLAVVDSTGAIAHNGVFINNNGAVLMKNNTSDNVDAGYGSRQDMDGSNYCTIALNNGTHYVRSDSAWKFYVMGNGQIHSTSQSISGISDVRLKENITDIDTGLAEIMALQPRRFDWKDGGGTVLAGFVAQEVESVLPDLIGNFKHDDFEDAKSLRMGDILPTLVKAMQEQQALIEALTARITGLEGA